jgi:hypothetical protein
MKPATSRRVRAAWIVALLTDAIQIGLLPFTATLSTWIDKPLDVLVMVVLWRLLGWHLLLLPSFALEMLPYVEVAPTWTLAVWLMTRRRGNEGDPSSQERSLTAAKDR